ncbi:hypothetical protein CHS0354_024336 [Potamilus streckersoni]|uniref:Uncharacterized protein n=1 Tax=Potamilus streckersoni TaxID=2493646 RepID=A0AAE0TII4_9BIVA|nr:hypothetical protein CHS0354_024336 [Potamilus streckersoni]
MELQADLEKLNITYSRMTKLRNKFGTEASTVLLVLKEVPPPTTTKTIPTTPTQTRLNDNGRKPQGQQTSSKGPALLPTPPRRTNIANHQLKTQPVFQIS